MEEPNAKIIYRNAGEGLFVYAADILLQVAALFSTTDSD